MYTIAHSGPSLTFNEELTNRHLVWLIRTPSRILRFSEIERLHDLYKGRSSSNRPYMGAEKKEFLVISYENVKEFYTMNRQPTDPAL